MADQNVLDTTFLTDENYEVLDLSIDDTKLQQLLVDSLEENVDYWNEAPWRLAKTDKESLNFLLGEEEESLLAAAEHNIHKDNRLFTATRAILSYATGQTATPEVIPSRSDDQYVKMARAIQSALYQHAQDNQVGAKTRVAATHLVSRKRGYLKLRYNPNLGMYGDIETEVCNPEDIIIDRHAKFMDNPNKIYHRIRCSTDELIAKFPNKEQEIRQIFSIKQGRYSQMARFVTYFECWFTYMDSKNVPREGVAWFINDPAPLILDKKPNPNWVYTGDDRSDKQTNVAFAPPKPFVWFNYINLKGSFIDETCLLEQAKPLQEALNARREQFHKNVDLMNGRWVFSKKAFNEADAAKFVNKGEKSIALVNADDVGKVAQVLTPNVQPSQVYESLIDDRNEIDTMMGTPSQFRGASPEAQNTLGRDLMVKQQAGMLQDDLVKAIQIGMERYYQLLLQMMRVYYTDDYWFQVKGGDGKFDFVMLSGDSLDSNVRIGVQVDSTLPIDKAQIRMVAMELAKMNRIDPLTLLEDLGLPNPEIRAERLLRSQIDMYTYMQSVEQGMDNNDAEVDVMLVTANKEPQERDDYDQGYLDYFNHFMTTNRFAQLPQDVKQRLVAFLAVVQHKAAQTAQLSSAMLNDAGIINRPPIFPLPKRTENIRLVGDMSPQRTEQIAGSEGQMFEPVTQAEQAQNPNQPQQGSPLPGSPV